ncbi:hypothetical protein [Membranihabitans maritimus]|uniref:hypothetical protein n=1 Tax=Membranihabitans maritimus TaxID=2904244 RepID=UPI001F255078|nr:hypothetical protein [Membranihabitans maritimus]
MRRRDLLRNGIRISVGMAMGINNLPSAKSQKGIVPLSGKFNAVLPLPIQVVIDDVGWWSGKDGSRQGEPYRSGIKRNHTPEDYNAIAELGKTLNIRPQAAMVLCEWDKNNILRKIPTSTWMGRNWDNSRRVGPWMEQAADIIKRNKAHIELTIHGVGHEYWVGGKPSRAEWAEVNGRMRPRDQVEKHLDAFEEILEQHQLGPFPASFVPTAFNHGFGRTPGRKISMAKILSQRGVKYINTPFHQMYNAEAVQYQYFGFDADVITINRGKDLLEWDDTGKIPAGNLNGPTCGMHWANLIHPDPSRNSEIVNKWVELLKPYDRREDTMLAPDSIFFQNQLMHYECLKMSINGDRIVFDFTELDLLPGNKVKNFFVLKIKGKENLKFTSDTVDVESERVKTSGYGQLHILRIYRKREIKKATLVVS